MPYSSSGRASSGRAPLRRSPRACARARAWAWANNAGSILLVLAIMLTLAGPRPGMAATPVDMGDEDELVRHATEQWTGDFDAMSKRRIIRALVPFNKMMYWLDGASQRGTAYEELRAFEETINKKIKDKALGVRVVYIPVPRDQLISGLVEGRGDVAVGNLTVTPERAKRVDFSQPFLGNVKEVVVTGPHQPPVASVDDLSGREIHVRKSSSYYESLTRLNQRFAAEGKPQVSLQLADENLEDDDLIEMANAGMVPMLIMDDHKARFWAQVFDRVTVHEGVAVREGGEIAWAFRKNSPKLKAAVNEFAEKHKKGTLFGNMMFNRYLADASYVKNSLSATDIAKFNQTISFFRKYAGLYDFDYLMVMAQAYQESGLDQSRKSRAGAVGVMQVRPATASDPNVNIAGIDKLENNIHAGVKYLRFITDRYFADDTDPVNQTLLAFAAYNAGPARIAQLRKLASEQRLDANKWFQNVEIVAAKKIGRETVDYVGNIYKYYVAYKMLVDQQARRDKARQALGG
ncbi:MAG: lytic transglycosylase F [Rhodospirillales bacterium]|nr:lytic transglycosylase F [Rhodospirillales bacterium]